MNLQYKKSYFLLAEGVALAHNSYTMSTCGLPDMYTISPWACSTWASGVHTRAHDMTIT